MNKPEFRVERGPVPEPEPFAIGMAKLLEREGRTVAAAELRRLHAQRDALLEVLKMLVLATKDFSVGNYNEEVHDIALSKARAAIKQAEEKV